MKTTRVILVTLTLTQSFFFLPVQAQVRMSPRQLTQRVAPQPAPVQPNAPQQPGAPPPGVVVVQPPVDPAKAQADKEEAARKAAEFRKQREAEGAQTDAAEAAKRFIPMQIEVSDVKPDPQISLQSVNLSLTNSAPKAITKFTMQMVYYDKKGDRVGEWTTRRELDQPLPPNRGLELSQPAYYMPLFTKRVKAEVKEVRYADGTEWSTPGK